MNSNKFIFFIILIIGCLGQVGSDIYTPSLPAIAINLDTHINYVQWSMAIYMLGIAASQLIYGPISEGVGRKSPLLIGLIIMLIGSLICLFAPNIELLIAGRFIQGCGAGACTTLWRSIFRDRFSGKDLAKYGSYLAIVVTFIIPAAPTLGGYLQHYFGWRANFVFLCLYTITALWAVSYGLKETSKHHHIDKLQLSYIVSTFRQLLTNRMFIGITLCVFLTYGAFFAWLTAGPVLLIHILGITPVAFGWITFLGGGAAFGLAGWLNGKFVNRFGMPTMMRLGWSIMILAGLLMLTGYYLVGINIWMIVIPVILFYFGSTFIWPNAFATAFSPFGDIAGYAAAIYGLMQIGGGAVMGAIISFLPDTNQIPLAMSFVIAPMLAWLIYEFTVQPSRRNVAIEV